MESNPPTKVEDISETVRKLKGAICEAKRQMDNVLAEGLKLEKGVAALKKENTDFYTSAAIASEKMLEKDKDIASMRRTMEELKREMSGYVEERTTAKSLVCKLSQKNSEMQHEIEALKTERGQHKATCAGFSKERADTAKKLKKIGQENEKLKEMVDNQTVEINRLRKANKTAAAVLVSGTG